MIGKILRAMAYKSAHDGVFWLLMALTFLLCLLFWNGMNIRSIRQLEEQIETVGLSSVASAYAWEAPSGERTGEEAREAFFVYYISYSAARMLREVNPIRFLSLYAAAYLIGTLFTRGTIRTMLFRGHRRGPILLSSLLFYCAVIAVSLAMSVFMYVLLKFGARGASFLFSAPFLRKLGLWLLLAAAALMPQFVCAFYIRNLFGTLFADLIVMLFFVFLPTGGFRGVPLSGSFGDYLPFGILEKEALWMAGSVQEPGKQLLLYLIPIGVILLSAFAAWLGFRKSALK